MTPEFDDPDCPKSDALEPVGWIAGHDITLANIPVGQSRLEICGLIDKTPCEYVVVKGGASSPSAAPAAAWPEAWVTEMSYFPGDLATRKVQYFRFTTDLPDPGSLHATLQASVWPFPSGPEADPHAPPGLVAQWSVDCSNCEFAVDLTPLDPQGGVKEETKPSGNEAWYAPVLDPLLDIVSAPVKAADAVIDVVVGLFGGGDDDKDDADANVETLKADFPATGVPLVSAQTDTPLFPKNFYFRLVIYRTDKADSWPSDNTVVLQEVPKPAPIKITGPTATPIPTPPAYKAEIISYHGIIPPLGPKYPCFVVLEKAWPKDFAALGYTTDPAQAWPGSKPVLPGQFICEPDPEEPSLLEKVVVWVKAAIDWAAETWQALKKLAVEFIVNTTPMGLQCKALEELGVLPKGSCQQVFAIGLDAALVSLGIPPDIPNFDQLVDQGIEYLAAQAAAQIALPPELVEAVVKEGGPYAGLALSYAEEKLREEAQAAIENHLHETVKAIQLSYAKSTSWLPKGIPVRPDDYQPPAAAIRITRLPGVQGGDAGCQGSVDAWVTISANVLNNPPPGWESAINGLPTKLSPLKIYDFFINEADLMTQGWPSGPDKNFTIPALQPGESMEIPITFKPNMYKNGWSPLGTVSTSKYFDAWRILHEFGTITLSVSGTCGSDQYVGSAKAVWEE